jgi:CubicO group peptidase (beta-lactamase class C family)
MSHRIRRREFLVQSSRAALSFPLLPLVAGAQGNHSVPWETLVADLEKQIPRLMEEAMVPGLSIALIQDAKLRWRRGFGVKDTASKKPVDNDTVFEAASMSKPVFAYAVMKLCEKGVINLDTPLTKYTSERFLEGDPRLELITARHVLSHTSGFQNWRSEEKPLKIHFTPGEKWLYSGEGYSYLQSVVAHVTGQPIEPFMKANLFAPFGMASSGYVWNDMFEKRLARPHDKKGKPFDNKKSTATDAARYGSSGALLTTPTDYAKFLIEVIDPKASDAFRLTKKRLEEMLHPQVKVDDKYSSSWALGWQVQYSEKRNVIMHGGDNEGFHAFSAASVDGKSGYVMMTNGENGAGVLKKLMAGFLNPFLVGY